MTTGHCPRCLRFVSPLHPHDCPCDDWQHRRDRSARHRYATALALSLFVGGFGLLYVGTLPETRLPAASQLPRATETAAGAVAATGSRLADPAASAAVVDSAGALPPATETESEPTSPGDDLSVPATGGVPLPSMPASSPPDTATADTGTATWYPRSRGWTIPHVALPDGHYRTPQQGPGGWVLVTVFLDGEVRTGQFPVVDFCLCGPRHGTPTVVDLSLGAVLELGLDPGDGTWPVRVERLMDGGPLLTPPATDLEDQP